MTNKPIYILFLMNPKAKVAGIWDQTKRNHPSIADFIISNNLSEIQNYPNFAKINVMVINGFLNVSEDLVQLLCQQLQNLEWIHLWSAGVDNVLPILKTLPLKTIITNARGAYSNILAEYVMGAVLYFNKNIPQLLENKTLKNYEKFSMSRVEGKTLGIIGYGDIAKAIARVAKKGFNMRIIAIKRRQCERPPLIDELIIPNESDSGSHLKLFRESDYIVNVLPLTAKTLHYCGAEEFNAMKTSSVFINIGRGGTVDEEVLIHVLKNRRIRGAALDVFETEPLPANNELWNLDNVLLSPHTADITDDMCQYSMNIFSENLKQFEAGAKTSTEMITPIDIFHEY